MDEARGDTRQRARHVERLGCQIAAIRQRRRECHLDQVIVHNGRQAREHHAQYGADEHAADHLAGEQAQRT